MLVTKQSTKNLNTNSPQLLCKYGQPIMNSYFTLDYFHLSAFYTEDLAANIVADIKS